MLIIIVCNFSILVCVCLRINSLRTEINTYGLKKLYQENWFPLLDVAIMSCVFIYVPLRVTYLGELLPH